MKEINMQRVLISGIAAVVLATAWLEFAIAADPDKKAKKKA